MQPTWTESQPAGDKSDRGGHFVIIRRRSPYRETSHIEQQKQYSRRDLILLLLLGLVFIGAGLGLKDPWPSDEPRYALIAKEMVDSGEWLFPSRGGELYPDKPPLFMWAQAAFYRLTGSLAVAVVLPSLLSGLIVLIIIYDAGRRLWNRQTGLYAGLLLLLTPQFVLESQVAKPDAMVTAWIALGMYGFLRHLLLGPDRRWLWIGFAACGFGIITKGVGFLPLLAFIPFLVYRSRSAAHVPTGTGGRDGLIGIALMLAAVAVWLIPMLIQVEAASDPAYAAYRDNILFKQTGERYVTPTHHFEPWWYFLVKVIPPLWLPLFLLLPWLIPAWVRGLRANDGRLVVLLGWAALVILFFSVSPGKRGLYVLPALPWAALAAAPWLPGLVARKGVNRLGLLVALLFACLLCLAAIHLTWIDPRQAANVVRRYEFDLTGPLWLSGIASLSLTLGIWWWLRSGVLAFGGVMLVLWLTIGFRVYPNLDAARSGRALMERVEAALPTGRPLAMVDWKEQNLLQAQRPVTNFGYRVPLEEQARRAIAWLESHPDGMILVQERSLAPCFSAGTPVDLGVANRRRWYLVGRENVTDACG